MAFPVVNNLIHMEIFCLTLGVILGSIITWYAQGIEIDKKLDTVGIKRKEYQRLKKDHENLALEVDAIKERIQQMVWR